VAPAAVAPSPKFQAYWVMVPSMSADARPSKAQASWVHDDVNDAVGLALVDTAGSAIVQAMPLVPATVEVAVAPGQLPALRTVSPIAAVMRPDPEPTEVPRPVTPAGRVQPVLLPDLSLQ
jgi:hypothetical protein